MLKIDFMTQLQLHYVPLAPILMVKANMLPREQADHDNVFLVFPQLVTTTHVEIST
jgi:hypothetical protein